MNENVKIKIQTVFGEIEFEGDMATVKEKIRDLGQITDELNQTISVMSSAMGEMTPAINDNNEESESISKELKKRIPRLNNKPASVSDVIEKLLRTPWGEQNPTMLEIKEALRVNGIHRSLLSLSDILATGNQKRWGRFKNDRNGAYKYYAMHWAKPLPRLPENVFANTS